jgi:hypothetical protein
MRIILSVSTTLQVLAQLVSFRVFRTLKSDWIPILNTKVWCENTEDRVARRQKLEA